MIAKGLRLTRDGLLADSTGAPRPVVSPKGKRRRPGTKTLAQALKCDDESFVSFVAGCLMYDPERRLSELHHCRSNDAMVPYHDLIFPFSRLSYPEPDQAFKHPFILSGRRRHMSSSPLPVTPTRTLPSSRPLVPTTTPRKPASVLASSTPVGASSTPRARPFQGPSAHPRYQVCSIPHSPICRADPPISTSCSHPQSQLLNNFMSLLLDPSTMQRRQSQRCDLCTHAFFVLIPDFSQMKSSIII